MYATNPPIEPNKMSEAEYLAFEESTRDKYEYSRGRVYAMSGGSVRHGVVTVNISTQLNIQLMQKNCSVASSDVKVHIASKKSYRYPDVTVFCGAPSYLAGRVDTLLNPVLLVEVTSPSTALLDRNEKLAEYTQIDSLQTYLLVAQDEPKIERFMRHESGGWLYQYVTGLDAEISVPSLDCTLALSSIYHKINWDEADTQTPS